MTAAPGLANLRLTPGTRGPIASFDVRRAQELIDGDWVLREIAAELNVSRSTLRRGMSRARARARAAERARQLQRKVAA